MNNEFDLYLASASPRRRELLQQIGVRFAVIRVDVPEIARPGEEAVNLVRRLAQEKAVAGWNAQAVTQRKPVLGADTVVVIDDTILGKPANEADAISMMQRLSGRRHFVMTAVALMRGECSVVVNVSEVEFRCLTLAECQAYWQTGEPADKAGGYAVQGRAAIFIKNLVGSYSGVMGLPLYETAQLLQQAAIPVWYPT